MSCALSASRPDAYLLLPYQQRWNADTSPVKVIEKSRRIGITYGTAAGKVIDAAEGLQDAWYIAYNEDAAIEFIRDAASWARKLNITATRINQFVLPDGDRSIQAYRVTTSSGKRVTALSSRPRNLRGKQGAIIIDEAAYHDDLDGLIKASIAMLMWGGSVEIISTHAGEANAFNRLVKDIRRGDKDFSLHRVTLDDALTDGLYGRICLSQGIEWTAEGEAKWRDDLINYYGAYAQEELFCVPMVLAEGMLFSREWFPIVPRDQLPKLGGQVRYWDLAATPKDPKKSHDPDFTAGCLMAQIKPCAQYPNGARAVLDMIKVRRKPEEVEELLRRTAQLDGVRTSIGYEEEPGSSGKFLSEHLRTNVLKGRRFTAIRSTGDKVSRARPVSAAAQRGDIVLVEAPWNADFLASLHAFPFGAHDDDVDAFTGASAMLESASELVRYMALQDY